MNTTFTDGSYKNLFSHPEMVESLMRDFVPEEWVRDLDFSTLQKQNGSYVADDLRERHDDIVWRVRCKGQWFYVYLLIEFQSTVDHWMAVRIMTYVGLLYQDLIKTGAVKNGGLLPPVFPLVLYNGHGAWTARREIAELIVPTSPVLTKYRPNLSYFLVDEGRISQEKLTGDSPAAFLVRMERSDAPEDLRQAIRSFRSIYGGQRHLSLRRALTVWIRRSLLHRLMPQEPLPELNDLEEVEAMLAERVTEWTEKWKMDGLAEGLAEGRRKGRVEGQEEGRKEGEISGRSAMLIRQLSKRFGQDAVDVHVQNRLRAASQEQLDLWAERILDATTIDDVFGE